MTEMRDLATASAEIRSARAAWKQRVHDNPAVMGEILALKPRELQDVLLVDLVQWLPGFGHAKLQKLGSNAALGKRVNLLVTLGNASSRTRHWLAQELRLLGDYYRPITLEMAA